MAKISEKVIKDDITVTQPVDLDQIETDVENLITGGSEYLPMGKLGTPTYQHLDDWFNITQSAGMISGGTISDNLDGSVTVAAGTGIIKTADSPIGQSVFFDWAEDTNVTLNDNSINYIYVDYNGGSPVINAIQNCFSLNFTTQTVLGRVYRRGTNLTILNIGCDISNEMHRMIQHHFEVYFIQRASGMRISEVGTRNLASTSGVFYTSFHRGTTTARDTSAADTFTGWYRNGSGGWTLQTSQTQWNNTQYDDGDGSLGTISNNKFGVHWVYVDVVGEIHVLYGQAQYDTLSDARTASVPGTLPDFLSQMAVLSARIVFQESATTATDVSSVFDLSLNYGSASVHNELTSIQGGAAGEYFHLDAADYTNLTADHPLISPVNIVSNLTLDPTGFVYPANDSYTTMNFNSVSRLFTLSHVADYTVVSRGNVFLKTTDQTVDMAALIAANGHGIYFVYFNPSGVLTASRTPWSQENGDIFVSVIYWDAVNELGITLEERHGSAMSWATHAYLHATVGGRYNSGFNLSHPTNNGDDGSFELTAGSYNDEDIRHSYGTENSCITLYRVTGSDFTWDTPNSTVYMVDGAGVLYYDGGTGEPLPTVGTNKYVNYWLFAANGYGAGYHVWAIMGQATYDNLTLAKEEQVSDLDISNLPTNELIPLYRLTYKQGAGTTKTLESTSDFRTVSTLPSGSYIASDHGALAGLGDNDHPQYTLVAEDWANMWMATDSNAPATPPVIQEGGHSIAMGTGVEANGAGNFAVLGVSHTSGSAGWTTSIETMTRSTPNWAYGTIRIERTDLFTGAIITFEGTDPGNLWGPFSLTEGVDFNAQGLALTIAANNLRDAINALRISEPTFGAAVNNSVSNRLLNSASCDGAIYIRAAAGGSAGNNITITAGNVAASSSIDFDFALLDGNFIGGYDGGTDVVDGDGHCLIGNDRPFIGQGLQHVMLGTDWCSIMPEQNNGYWNSIMCGDSNFIDWTDYSFIHHSYDCWIHNGSVTTWSFMSGIELSESAWIAGSDYSYILNTVDAFIWDSQWSFIQSSRDCQITTTNDEYFGILLSDVCQINFKAAVYNGSNIHSIIINSQDSSIDDGDWCSINNSYRGYIGRDTLNNYDPGFYYRCSIESADSAWIMDSEDIGPHACYIAFNDHTASNQDIINSSNVSGIIGGGNSQIDQADYALISHAKNANINPGAHYSVVSGRDVHADLPFSHVKGTQARAAQGDRQMMEILAWASTTDATSTPVKPGETGSQVDIVVPANRVWKFKGEVVARQHAGGSGTIGDCKVWDIEGVIKRDGADNTALVGTVSKTVFAEDSGATNWDIAATANDTLESLEIAFTGEADKSVNITSNITIIQVG